MQRRALALCISIGLAGCVNTQMVQVRNLRAEPPPVAGGGWKRDVQAVLTRYAQAPGLSPGDERFRPIFGGVATLAYFGADFEIKLEDQRIAPGWSQPGSTLAEACAVAPVAPVLSAHERPPFSEVWIPQSIDGRALAAGALCSPTGAATGGTGHFCMFGRLALQAEPRPLILVVHGMFDSSAQEYVQRMGASLYALGYSTLLLDMRDHGDTFRAAPAVPTTLGHLEAYDLLASAQQARAACGPRVSAVGAIGVSGGGLAVLAAYAADGRGATPVLDAGVIALSPLVDVPGTIESVESAPVCSVVEAAELTWQEYVLSGALGAVTFAGGAASAQLLSDDGIDENTAIAAGIGAAAGLFTGILIDGLLDGDSATSQRCIARGTIGHLFADLLRERWETLQRVTPRAVDTQPLHATPSADATLSLYLRERSARYYHARGLEIPPYEPSSIAAALARRPASKGVAPKLLMLAADDDPVTPASAHLELAERVASLPDVLAAAVPFGGHGGMWVIHEPLTRAVIARVFQPAR